MKKLTLFLFCFISFAAVSFVVHAAEVTENPKFNMLLNGVQVDFPDEAKPINVDGRTLVQLHYLFGLMDDGEGSLDWNEEERRVTITIGETTAILFIDNTEAEVNGETVIIDGTGPFIYDNRTYLPLRFIAESFDKVVNWDGITSTAAVMDNELNETFLAAYSDLMRLQYENEIYFECNVKIKGDIDYEGTKSTLTMLTNTKAFFAYKSSFMHIIASTETKMADYSESQKAELYDDGINAYVTSEGITRKQGTTIGELLTEENFVNPYEVGDAGYFAAFLTPTEDARQIVYKGYVSLPSDVFGFIGEQEMSASNILDFAPDGQVFYSYVIDKASGLIISYHMNYVIDAIIGIETGTATVKYSYTIDIPVINYNAIFTPVVPQKVKDSVVEIEEQQQVIWA